MHDEIRTEGLSALGEDGGERAPFVPVRLLRGDSCPCAATPADTSVGDE